MSKRANNKRGAFGYRNRHKPVNRDPITGQRIYRPKRRAVDGTMRIAEKS